MTNILNCLLMIVFLYSASGVLGKDIRLLNTYPMIIERLLLYKNNDFKAFFGGPVERGNHGVQWIMPVLFEDENHKTRAVYEIAFINCDLNTAHDAEIIFISVADIDIKLKNMLTQDFTVFSALLNGDYKSGKYIVVRFADVINVYFPDVFVFSEYGEKRLSDQDVIVDFLHTSFNTSKKYVNYYDRTIKNEINFEDESLIIYNDIPVAINFDGTLCHFFVKKIIKKNDLWRVYYVISKKNVIALTSDSTIVNHVRFDSGCISGQIYGDQACDCLEQLHDFLKQFAYNDDCNGIVIHMPTHDGRGFGCAPKAETEIYKRGGRGRIHATLPIDTVAAAKLLYGVCNYDLRTFDGASAILQWIGIKSVVLVTDNIEKVAALQNYGIEVIRKKTDTNKASCLIHINAKKNSGTYFLE